MRILIADDDRLSAHILKASLQAGGYEVTVATDGAEAWQILQSDDRPKLAILDWMMPGMDGLEVCRRVRQAGGPYIYILLLTANTGTDEVITGIDSGADDYIKKPFNPDELRARLRTGMRIVDLEEKLRLQATHDPLTGLLNRAAIIERLQVELRRAERENESLSVGMADVDFFKRINDTHGHAAGDTVLRETARKMRAMLRPYDVIGRYGGEEFIIIFPKCGAARAAAIAERVRAFIASEPVDLATHRIHVTTSLGLADTTVQKDISSLIQAADAAMFRAKDAGRNRVECVGLGFGKAAAAR
jgi:diguanylate cyclase (GGDEF)-like protein